MEAFTDFLANNYIWFLIVAIIMAFALVGYLVDRKETKLGRKLRVKKQEQQIIDFTTIEQAKPINSISNDNKVLDLNESASINEEEMSLDTEEKKIEFEVIDNKSEEVETLDDLESIDLGSSGLPELQFEGTEKNNVN